MDDAQRQKRLARKALRRAVTSGAEAEMFTPIEIFERDGWICGLCTLPVDPDLSYPDPMCASLDHVVPIIAGGPHTRGNTQCSHLTCNIRKGARMAPAIA